MTWLILLSCAVELPYEATQVCDEIRWALDGHVLACTDDSAQVLALDAALDAEVPCGVVAYGATLAELGPGLATGSGRTLTLEQAYACPNAVASLPCGSTDPVALWEALLALEPQCDGLREPLAADALTDCAPTPEGHLVCHDPLPWAEARDACASARLVLWSSDVLGLLPTLIDRPGRYWMGLSVTNVGAGVTGVGYWSFEDGEPLYASDFPAWGIGEPDPLTLGTAVSFEVSDLYGTSWYAEDPTLAYPFVCENLAAR